VRARITRSAVMVTSLACASIMPLGGQRHQLCDNAVSYDVVCPLRCRIGIGPIPDRAFFTFSHSAQAGLRNFMAPVLANERCAFTTRLRLTGVRPNSLANRTALS
jgi:hypothetical protein